MNKLPFPSRIRAKIVFALALFDVGVIVILTVAAYSWSWNHLVSVDIQQCGIPKSILDIAILSILRDISLALLLTDDNAKFHSRTTHINNFLAFCGLCSFAKAIVIATKPEHCDGNIQRSFALALAAACEQIVMSAVQLLLCFWLTKSARRLHDLERAIRDASVSHSQSDLEDVDPAVSRKPAGGARSNTKALLDRARPEVKWLVAGCVALIIRLPFSLALPHFVSATIGGLLDKDVGAVRFNITCFIVAGIVDALLDFWCVFLFGYTQQRIIRSLRLDLFRNLLHQEVSYYDTTSTGDISSRLTSDTAEMANDLTWVFRFTIEAIVRICGIGGYMFYQNWRMAALACVVIPIIAAINRKYGEWMADNAKQVQAALADANSVAQEVISAMKTVFSFANEVKEFRRYEECVQRHYHLNVRQTVISGVYYMVVSTFLTNMGVQAALMIYGSTLVLDGSMKAQTLLAFMLYQGQLQEYFRNLFNSFTNLVKSAGAGAQVFELLARSCQIKRTGTLKLTDVQGKVSFESVRFVYASRDQAQPALDDVSFEALRGEVVAFVGPSGGGKSTIFNLIEHFYEPTSGRVCLDDVCVWDLDHRWLHRVIALVGQEPVLFSGSIESNIRYSSEAATLDEVIKAATVANAHAFVSQLPKGYQTGVGERGVQLSGGQKQRVAIARAILQDPAVLLLDEATSALDSESEHLVQEALEHAMRGRTTLVIAHRLSTISRADRIVFIQRGRVLEVGSHRDLIAKPLPQDGGLSYRALIEKQARALEGDQL